MDTRKELARMNAILTGNYFIALKERGRVATTYINMDPAYTHPKFIGRLGALLMGPYVSDAQVIAGPAIGGIPLVYATARASRLPQSIRTVWADKLPDGTFAFERMSFAETIRNNQVLIVEDVTTTGNSAKEVGTLVEAAGGTVLAYSFVWNRGGIQEKAMGAPVHSIIDEPVPSYLATEHHWWGVWPLVTDIGHPEHFPDYPGPRTTLLT